MRLRIDGDKLVVELSDGPLDLSRRNYFALSGMIPIPLAEIESVLAVHRMQRPAVEPAAICGQTTERYRRMSGVKWQPAATDETSDE